MSYNEADTRVKWSVPLFVSNVFLSMDGNPLELSGKAKTRTLVI